MIDHKAIAQKRRDLEAARREFVRKAVAEYDKKHYAALRELHEACSRFGHNWHFTHVGPVGHAWFSCSICGATEARED